MCLYVDDILIFGTNMDVILYVKSLLTQNFDMKDLGEAKIILHTKIIRKDNMIILSQEHYTEQLLRKFGYFDLKSVSTTFNPTIHLKKNTGNPVCIDRYAQIIGSLGFSINFTRPDLVFVVNRLSRYYIIQVESTAWHLKEYLLISEALFHMHYILVVMLQS